MTQSVNCSWFVAQKVTTTPIYYNEDINNFHLIATIVRTLTSPETTITAGQSNGSKPSAAVLASYFRPHHRQNPDNPTHKRKLPDQTLKKMWCDPDNNNFT